jgi:hypothetical protein
MSPSSPDAWPDAPEGLARLAADIRQPEDVRRRAFEALLPTIRSVVLRLAMRFTGQPRDDLSS